MTTTGMDAFEMSEDDVPGEGPEGEDEKWGALRVIGLVALVAAFSGFVYLAYMQGVRNGSAGAPPVVTAQAGPYKEQPADPGGRTFADAEKLIYQRVEGQAPGVGGTKSAPKAETPAELAPDKEQNRIVDGGALVVADVAPSPIKPQQRPSGISSATERSNAQGGPVSSATVQSPTKVADAAPPDPAPGDAAKAQPQGDIESKIASIESAKAAPPPVNAAPSPARDGAYVIQIASYRDRPSAEGAYTKLLEKHADLVSSLSPDYQTAQVSGKGTYFRLRIGPFESQEDASSVCKALKARRQDCLVVKS
jgi:cell division protein FtsN